MNWAFSSLKGDGQVRIRRGNCHFFSESRESPCSKQRLWQFVSTHKAEHTPENDPNLKALLAADTQLVTIFGNSWTLHVTDALEITLERNLQLIQESVG